MKIKEIMEKKKMTMYRLHKLSGVSYSHVWDVVNEEKSPTLMILQKLADALEVTVAEILGEIPLDDKSGPNSAA